MAAPMTTITITHPATETTAALKAAFQVSNDAALQADLAAKLLQSLAIGNRSSSSVTVAMDDGDRTHATGTIVFSAVASASDTVTINGTTFTFRASGATGNEANIGANATASAANLATAVNASATALVNAHVTAAAATGTVTFTSVGHLFGNSVTIAKGTDAGSVMTVSGARLTGGAVSANSTTITSTFP